MIALITLIYLPPILTADFNDYGDFNDCTDWSNWDEMIFWGLSWAGFREGN